MNHQLTSTSDDPSDYVREVTARYIGPRRKSIVITSVDMAADFMRKLLRDQAREHLIALYLNASHQTISHSIVALGTATSAPAHPREVFQPAILLGACAVIIGHNHPSGYLKESHEDIEVTRRLMDAGKLLAIPLLDHILLAPDSYVSLKQRGYFD